MLCADHMSLVLRKPVFGVSDQVRHKPVTAKLICVFVFAYAKSRFSHNEAHIWYIIAACMSLLTYIFIPDISSL